MRRGAGSRRRLGARPQPHPAAHHRKLVDKEVHALRIERARLLLETGRRISEKHLRIFKSWGVAVVAVKGSAAGDGSTCLGADVPAPGVLDDAFRERFAGALDDPVMVAIMEAAARHLAGRGRKRKVRHGRS
jgi:hypothetical protein